jgi:hypothetical protein
VFEAELIFLSPRQANDHVFKTGKGASMDTGRGKVRAALARRRAGLVAVACFFTIALGVTFAVADSSEAPTESSVESPVAASQEITEAIEGDPQATAPESGNGSSPISEPADTQAAEALPHHDLTGNEARALLDGVFGQEVENAAGIFDELHVEKFLASNVAVIPAGEQPEGAEGTENQDEGSTLMSSSVPLRVEASPGNYEPLDLQLEHSEGELRTANPLVKVGIPSELGEGVALPESGVQINLVGAPEGRSPSTTHDVAFYPNVAEDSDLVVAPTPTGVEEFSQLRSADAPRSITFNLNLPTGASLLETEDGGAEVRDNGEMLIDVPSPTANDATGSEVPVSLSVSGHSLTLRVSPDQSAMYPVLVDPLFQTYTWQTSKTRAGINGNGDKSTGESMFNEEWTPEVVRVNGKDPFELLNHSSGHAMYETDPVQYNDSGLYVFGGGSGSKIEPIPSGVRAAWIYAVPRYFSDKEHYGSAPETYISHLTLSRLLFHAFGVPPIHSPYMELGIITPGGTWLSNTSMESSYGHDLEDMSHLYEFGNASNPEGKIASAGLWSFEPVPNNGDAGLFVGAATVELSEPAGSVPKFGSPLAGPTQWVNQEARPITFTASDSGLGVYAVTVSDEQATPHSWKTAYGCVGVGGSACPHTWESSEASHPALKYEPSVLPQGIDKLKLVAEDPLGHVSSTSKVEVKVDHTAPSLSLSGSLTEQAKLGTARAHYALKLSATDGTEAIPQSGVASTEIKVDGTKVDSFTPGCTTKNCEIAHEWTLNSASYSAGKWPDSLKSVRPV